MRLYFWISLTIWTVVFTTTLRIAIRAERDAMDQRYNSMHSQRSDIDEYAASEFHKRLVAKWELPPVTAPGFEPATEPDSVEEPVIGVVVDGQPVAFPVAEMGAPDNHLVQFAHGKKNLMVTHCNLSGCSRVFAMESHQSNQIRMGGLQEDGKMVLLVDQVRYSQDSIAIPLTDFEFQVMPFSHWTCEHPETILYTGQKEINFPAVP